mgnify:CR=1 FL=1
MCFEVLIATIFLWVSIFGISDIVMGLVEQKWKRAGAYTLLAVLVALFLGFHKNVSVCGLM